MESLFKRQVHIFLQLKSAWKIYELMEMLGYYKLGENITTIKQNWRINTTYAVFEWKMSFQLLTRLLWSDSCIILKIWLWSQAKETSGSMTGALYDRALWEPLLLKTRERNHLKKSTDEITL